MSGDFAEAIAAGATHLRIGTAITGPRPCADSLQNRRANGGCDVEPAQEDHGVPGPRRRGRGLRRACRRTPARRERTSSARSRRPRR
jgi:hypothetical protein